MNSLKKSKAKFEIIKFVRSNLEMFNSFSKVYLFGSVLYKDYQHFNDIDLLIIYSNFTGKIFDNIKQINNEMSYQFNIPIDLTVLSEKEEKQVNFLERVEPFYIRLK
ncbi:MAG: nucleotidyltransferase domain-containing protein [Lactobacillus sp.]|nr:nucleotidyltransferase domain-containing protein [Lactobacillus sp.]